MPASAAGAQDASLARTIDEARRAWPSLAIDEGFVAHARAKLEGAPEGSLRAADLLLAYACVRRDDAAIAAFEAAYFGEVEAARRRFNDLPVTADDVVQRVRQKLYLDTPPALLGYAGQGDLRSWVRAAVLHMLINIATRESRERPTGDALFDAVIDASPDAEAAYLKRACHEEFEQAFDAAMLRLDARERMLLKYAFADGLTVDQIGAVFRVHRATAARWVTHARERLVAEARADLMARLKVDEGEAASIVRAALSRMGTTLLRRLG
jgi:RNA polymerase sigma-70 factor (ECF subfamily)